MARPAKAIINLSAIQRNYSYARGLGQQHGGKTVMVIKANAYGHGATEIAQFMDKTVDMFGVASIDEAQQLRAHGVCAPILLMEGCFDQSEWAQAQVAVTDVVVHNQLQLDQLSMLNTAQPLSIWLKVDTGMHRLGFSLTEAQTALAQLNSLAQVKQVILMTHLADADNGNSDITQQQLSTFKALCELPVDGISIANSASLLFWPDARAHWNRPGLMLYGVSPRTSQQQVTSDLQAAMTLQSQVIALRTIQAGESVGYNCRWTAQKNTVVATVAMGYGDGYPRNASNGTPVMLHGKRVPLIGRVSMDMLTIDVTDVANVAVGDTVELWGKSLSVSEVASHCDSNSYEMLTRLAERVKKQFITD